jgi:hypothetical protein
MAAVSCSGAEQSRDLPIFVEANFSCLGGLLQPTVVVGFLGETVLGHIYLTGQVDAPLQRFEYGPFHGQFEKLFV